MKRLWLLVTVMLLGFALPARAAPDLSRIDAFVAQQMDAMQIPGVALAVVQGDQIIYAKGYGQAGAERPVIGPAVRAVRAGAHLQAAPDDPQLYRSDRGGPLRGP
ncbi:MAG TPA: hypothetical protein VD902_15090 [Symbiobacteriaceae bacterium]|nr:hypothetical protein [Symbiobacteriaceae bacterium]